jgi:predicted membrane-bound mannosyltransferase
MAHRFLSPRALPVTVSVLLGTVWRLWLMGRYAGWEESDYGNLAMIQGVLDGGFLHYDMNHMPGYYAAAAMVHGLVGDAVFAGRAVSLLGGVVALGIAVAWAVRMGGTRAGWAAGLLLIVQPDILHLQLYSNVMHLLALQENQILQQEQLQKKVIVLNVQQENGVLEQQLNAQILHA